LEVLGSKSTDKVRMAGVGPSVAPKKVEYGSLIIFHDTSTNTVLLGEEAINLFNEKDKKHPFWIYNINIISACLNPNTGGVATAAGGSRPKTLEELTLEYIPIFKKNVSPVWIKRPEYARGLTTVFALDDSKKALYPIVAKERTPCTDISLVRYFSNPRIRNPAKKNGFPKGGAKTNKDTGIMETPLQCMKREVYEEIGNIDPALVDTAKHIGISTVEHEDNISNYTIYYKPVTPAQRSEIETAIRDRYAESIGESFDLGFKNIRGVNLNQHSLNAVVMCNTHIDNLARLAIPPVPSIRLLGGAKKTRRSHRKRRTTSKRR
jgi:hypothetical protein